MTFPANRIPHHFGKTPYQKQYTIGVCFSGCGPDVSVCVMLNKKIIFRNTIDQSEVEFLYQVNDTEDVTLMNITVLTSTGGVILKKIMLEELDVTDYLLETGEYIAFNQPDQLHPQKNMSQPGYQNFWFETPIYPWLLQNF